MNRRILLQSLALPFCAALAGCLGNSGSSSAPPTGVQAYAGDTAISVTWNDDPSINYWLFHAQDPTLDASKDISLLLAGGVLVNVSSPTILCGLINNPSPTPIFPSTFITINGRTGTAPGGRGSSLVSASPRPAGGTDSGWIAGPSIPASINSLGYAPVSGCGYAGRPASGYYVAVGNGGVIYTAQLAPTVAGPLTLSQGNSPMTWTRANTPTGFSENLTGVAAYTLPGSIPATPAMIFVAVGRGGTILRSVDGINWGQVNGVPTSEDLNDVASTGSSFIAVGNAGTVLTSGDGITWTLSTTAASTSGATLNAIHCAGATCVAVGDAGTTMWTFRSGVDWTLYTFGTTSWTGVAYGSNNLNADYLISDPGGVLTVGNRAINTWVITDRQGDYAYSFAGSGAGFVAGTSPFSSSITAIDYTTRFIALDGAGNAYASETGVFWQSVGASGVSGPVAMRSNGMGYVAVGATGTNASSF